MLRHPHLNRFKKRKILRIYRETIFHRKKYHEFIDEYGRHWLITVTYGDQMDGDFLLSVKDVSDFKRIEQTAYQNDKLAMLGKISAAIAHEIRNPLTAIRGFIQLLRPHLVELGKDEYARIILTEIDRANDIIHEFLNSSKPSAPQKSTVSVSSLLKEVVLLTESEAVMKGCQMMLHAPEEELLVSIDVKQIKQVLLNIIKKRDGRHRRGGGGIIRESSISGRRWRAKRSTFPSRTTETAWTKACWAVCSILFLRQKRKAPVWGCP
ncbi:hypothetical protein HMSSN036_29230 [Paenibacillus macerans]|nr:hypothetical protein HMSSN036_29230 [Paenibacillus macerans]